MENLDGSLEALKTTYKPARAVSWDRTSNYEMEVLSCDMIYDLAVLRSKWPNHEAKKISIKWRPPTLGTEVFSAGYRMGLPLAPKVGYYGVRQTQLPKPRVGITIPVASGDSGSPVFTADGKLVALVSAVYGYSNYQGNVIPIANITMAIPGIIIKIFVEETIYDSQKGKGRTPITSPHS
jgi:S1-C subfamily serine protease